MSETTQRMIESNGIRLNIAEQGKGPLVLLCHGFPESWYSWRHQIDALAAAASRRCPDGAVTARATHPGDDHHTIFHWSAIRWPARRVEARLRSRRS
jgi:pimeloyl-ACP methyl ester carboxylesterase